MKKSGLLNADLMGELTKLRHLDQFVVCDIGFPIPEGANVVDVSLVEGLPTFLQVLKAVLNEVIVEGYMVFDFMKEYNQEYYSFLKENLVNQTCSEVSMEGFIQASAAAKLFIRTGEPKPASNILLTSATGVRSMNEKLDVHFGCVI